LGGITIKTKNKLSITIIISAFLITTTIVQAQIINNSIKENINKSTISIELSFSENDFIFEKLNGYDVIYLSDAGILNEVGKPALPAKIIMVALPENMKATGISIVDKIQKRTFFNI
jgi:hypothetical protein